MSKKPILLLVGTRPEMIKLAPVHLELRRRGHDVVLVSTGQHRQLLDETAAAFGIRPDFDLEVMRPGQKPIDVLQAVCASLPPLIERLQPSWLVVQGDTTSALAGALVAHYERVPLGHVEAGLRTNDLLNPFPEEANRQLIDRVADLCFAPSDEAREHLIDERIPEARIRVCGNTAIDALTWMVAQTTDVEPTPNTLLITLHRRESFGTGLTAIIDGVLDFLRARPDARVTWPAHPNPNVREVTARLASHPQIEITEPASYRVFCQMLRAARLILSDSGGIQEEAPSLGKRVLVARDTTERPEGVLRGRNILVGRQRERIFAALQQYWDEPPYTGPFPAPNPFGDGLASARICDALGAVATV